MMLYIGETFLNKLYKDLHLEKEVMHTALSSDSKNEKVKKYLDRLERIENLALNSKYNGLELLKRLYYKKYVIKKENIPESYYELQKKIALDRGFGHIEIDNRMKEELSNALIEDQKKSLDMWLDYLISKDSMYPEWFKYYAFQGMLRLGTYDKEKESFNRRTESTTNIFIELNREALALIYDNLMKTFEGNKVDDKILQVLLENGSFSKLYAYVLKKLEQANKDIKSNDGIWIKYNKGEDPNKLVDSLQGRGTGWCTAAYETAKTQLSIGDFYVYYTKDSTGEYKQPRIAIRMEDNSIGEIRGISENQNLEPGMKDILNEKLKEFPDRDKYNKKVSDMEKLTKIYNEYKDRELEIDELRFLYEIDSKIEGFGYSKDPRIKEILENRNFKEDLAKVFNCSPNEISNNKRDVLNGKNVVCFYGFLDLGSLTTAEGLKLPEYIGGDLDLDSLTTAEGLKLPEYIGGDLGLDSLTTAEGLKLPEYIGGDLGLDSLTTAEGLKLPEHIGRSLDLDSLTIAEGLKLPEYIGGYLWLSSLTTAEGLVLPNNIGGDLYLKILTTIDGVIVPENFKCGDIFSNYITLEDLINKSKEHNSKRR